MRVELFRQFILVIPKTAGGSCDIKPRAQETRNSRIIGRHLERLGRRHNIQWHEGNCLIGSNQPLWKLKLYTRFLPALKELFYGVHEKPCIVVRDGDGLIGFVLRRLRGNARLNVLYYSEDLRDFDSFEARLLGILSENSPGKPE